MHGAEVDQAGGGGHAAQRLQQAADHADIGADHLLVGQAPHPAGRVDHHVDPVLGEQSGQLGRGVLGEVQPGELAGQRLGRCLAGDGEQVVAPLVQGAQDGAPDEARAAEDGDAGKV